MEEALASCVKTVQEQLGEPEHVLTVVLLNETPHLSSALPLENLHSLLPPSFRTNLLGAVSMPHEVSRRSSLTAPPFTPQPWASLHCMALPSPDAVELFHAPNDSLPALSSYRTLLTSDTPPTIMVLSQQSMLQRALLHRLTGVIPEGAKLCGLVTSPHFLVNSEHVRAGSVGLAFQPHPEHVEAQVAFARRLLGNVVLQDVQGDPATMQSLFVPSTPLDHLPFVPESERQDGVRPESQSPFVEDEPEEGVLFSDVHGLPDAGAIGHALMRGLEMKLPLFVLKWQSPVVPGKQHTFRIFEPRYRVMIKDAVEKNAPFILITPDSDTGTALQVVGISGVKEKDGCCLVETRGLCRVKVDSRWIERDTFGLTFGDAQVVVDKKLEGEALKEAEALRGIAVSLMERLVEELAVKDSESLDASALRDMHNMPPDQLSMWLVDSLRVSPEESQGWFALTDPLQRLRAQVPLLKTLLARYTASAASIGIAGTNAAGVRSERQGGVEEGIQEEAEKRAA